MSLNGIELSGCCGAVSETEAAGCPARLHAASSFGKHLLPAVADRGFDHSLEFTGDHFLAMGSLPLVTERSIAAVHARFSSSSLFPAEFSQERGTLFLK